MKRLKWICFVGFGILFCNVYAQQDPQYSQYMFNPLSLNPAYAGSREAIDAMILYRTQWTGLEGAPKTQTATVNGPLKKKKIGLGFQFVADQIGADKSTGFLFSYAYKIPIRNGKLSMGLRGGFYNYVVDWNKVTFKNQNDVYNTKNQTSLIVPNIDAGIYYNNLSWYAGISATHLYQFKLSSTKNKNGDYFEQPPHLILTAGKAFKLSDKVIFSPSFLLKGVQGAPLSADLSACFSLNQKLWLGVSYRYNYGIVALAQIHFTEKLKMGYSYDFGMNTIGKVGGLTHEIMLGYEFRVAKSKVISPRFF